MYFEIANDSRGPIDWPAVRAALLQADPFAGIHLEPQHGRLRIDGALDRSRVLGLLRDAGFSASHLPHETGGSTCCGGCS